jgi:hypothetical protein
MKTINAQVVVSLTFQMEEGEDAMNVLDEMAYEFYLENGDLVETQIIEQSFKEV